MGLFSWFKSNTFESMDELEQMALADGLGITDIKKDIRSIKAQLTDLENSSNWKDKVITAKEATTQLEAKIQAAMPEELDEVFEKIRKAIDDKQNSIVISNYKIQTEYHDGAKASSFSRNPYLADLEQELRKYHYETDLTDYGLVVTWPRKNSVIDPDKKYILPMEGTDWIDKGVRHYATIRENYWEPLQWADGVLPPHGPLYEVQGRDILDGPDWVKAIKPIEVKE